MDDEKGKTTIQVSKETHRKLKREFGYKGETWDKLLKRLLEETKERDNGD